MTKRCTARNGKVRAAIWKGLAQLVWRRVADLKLQSWNPRKHTEKQIRQIAKSIEAFGFNVPILIDSNSNVIAGHGRILACQLLDITKVPTICLEHLNECQIRAFMIADNKLCENSDWDDRLLAEQLRELSLVNLDFDLEATGFEMGEIDLHIESLSADDPQAEDTTPVQISGPPASLRCREIPLEVCQIRACAPFQSSELATWRICIRILRRRSRDRFPKM